VLCETFFTCREHQNTLRKSKPFVLYAKELRTLGVFWVTQRSLRHAKKAFPFAKLGVLCETFFTCRER
jgi:hypothetical protein